jgi:hypothetical protein
MRVACRIGNLGLLELLTSTANGILKLTLLSEEVSLP